MSRKEQAPMLTSERPPLEDRASGIPEFREMFRETMQAILRQEYPDIELPSIEEGENLVDYQARAIELVKVKMEDKNE